MVNVVVSGIPVASSTRCLRLGRGDVFADGVAAALYVETGLPQESFMLLVGGHIAEGSTQVAHAADAVAFVEMRLRRVLPGGKGGFGAMLRGSNASKKTTNFSACRDLSGRRLRDIERERARNSDVGSRSTSSPGPRGNESVVLDAHSESPDPEADQEGAFSREGPSVDVETVAEDIKAVAGEVEDAVAEGLRAARAARRKSKKRRSRLENAATDVDATNSEVTAAAGPRDDDAESDAKRVKLGVPALKEQEV